MSALPSSVVFLLVRSAPAIVDLAHHCGGRDTDAIRVDLETEGLALSRLRASKGRRATLFTIPTEHTASERAVLLFIDHWITQQENPPAMDTDVFAGETAPSARRMAAAPTPLSPPTPTTLDHAHRDVSPCGNRGAHGRRRQDGDDGATAISAPNSNDTTAAQVTGPTRDRSVRTSRASEQDIQLGRPTDPSQAAHILRRQIAIPTPEPDTTDPATPGLATDPGATDAWGAAWSTSAGGGDMDAAVRLLRASGMVRERVGADRRREGERDARRTRLANPRFRRRVVGDHLEYEPSA